MIEIKVDSGTTQINDQAVLQQDILRAGKEIACEMGLQDKAKGSLC